MFGGRLPLSKTPTMTPLPYLAFCNRPPLILLEFHDPFSPSKPKNSHDLVVCIEYFLGSLRITDATSSSSVQTKIIALRKFNVIKVASSTNTTLSNHLEFERVRDRERGGRGRTNLRY